MAAIDKIYGTKAQRDELLVWCIDHCHSEIASLIYPWPEGHDPEKAMPISCFPVWADLILWDECQLEFVRERLFEQYGRRPSQVLADEGM